MIAFLASQLRDTYSSMSVAVSAAYYEVIPGARISPSSWMLAFQELDPIG